MLQEQEVDVGHPPRTRAAQPGGTLCLLTKEAGPGSPSWLIATVTLAPASGVVGFKIWGPVLYPFSGFPLLFSLSGHPGSPNPKTAGSRIT